MMATEAGISFKEYTALVRGIEKLSDGQAQVRLIESDEDEFWLDEIEDEDDDGRPYLFCFLLTISPNDGHYKGSRCRFQVFIPRGYPEDFPEVRCVDKIYHPNINLPEHMGGDGNICVSLLGTDWEPGVGLGGLVNAVLFLFYYPNQDDALSPLFSGTSLDDEEFTANVREALAGGTVDGNDFDNLMIDNNVTTETAGGDDRIPTKERLAPENNDVKVETNEVISPDIYALDADSTPSEPPTEAPRITVSHSVELSSELTHAETKQIPDLENTGELNKAPVDHTFITTPTIDMKLLLNMFLTNPRTRGCFTSLWKPIVTSACHLVGLIHKRLRVRQNIRGAS